MAGEDTDEFMMVIENEFDITIDYNTAGDITTCRKLADYVISQLKNIDVSDSYCLSQIQFYRLRTILIKEFGAKRKDIRPNAPIRQFLGKDIKQEWKKLRETTNRTRFPDLHCKDYLVVSTALIAWCITAILFYNGFRWAALGAGLSLWIILGIFIGSQFADQLPPDNTVGALTPYIKLSHTEWSKHLDHILQHIIGIAADNFGIDIDKVHPDAHFLYDLHVS